MPHHTPACATEKDVQALVAVMAEVERLEEQMKGRESLSEIVIASKSDIKKLMGRSAKIIDSLELGGAPVWGLSSTERALVKSARAKLSAC